MDEGEENIFDNDIEEVYESDNMNLNESVEVDDVDESANAGDDSRSGPTSASTSASSTDANESELTISLLVNGKLFVLLDESNGKCLTCNSSLKTTNRGSNLTKHLVSTVVETLNLFARSAVTVPFLLF